MDISALSTTARALTAEGRGILAMDESTPTADKRFKALGIPQTPEKRRDYRELLLGTPGLEKHISGVILFDETIHQSRADGGNLLERTKKRGILLGIKVDAGAKPMALHDGEKVTEGLDGLRERLAAYKAQGAVFAKWRAVFSLGARTPSRGCLAANALGLARYAGLCQEAGLLPIVEPELLMDGDHDLARCFWVTEKALHTLFDALYDQRVELGGVLLKVNMVLAGKDCPKQPGVEAVADATVKCLLSVVPAAVPGVALLSGGQGFEQATARLKAMHQRHSQLPWRLTYSFGRALQDPALAAWKGDNTHAPAAQRALLERAAANSAAILGR